MDLYAKLSSNMNDLANVFDSRMNHIEKELEKYSTGDYSLHKDLTSLSKDFMDFKNLVWKSMAMMRYQLELTFQGLDRQETASRRKVLLFHGVAESSEIALKTSILKLLTDKFKMSDLSVDDLSACHRLGTNSSKPRPVIVRFLNYKHRNIAWNSKSALKNTGITISEFLTKSRYDIFTTARRHFGIKHCWTSEGKIIVLLPNNKRCRIETCSELKSLIVDNPTVHQSSDSETLSGAQGKSKMYNAGTSQKSSKPEPKSKRGVK